MIAIDRSSVANLSLPALPEITGVQDDLIPHSPEEVPGIVIREAHLGSGVSPQAPRIPVFVYGEALPSVPTLPYGRWKVAPTG